MFEYIIIAFLGILLVLAFLIYQKINNRDDFGVERAVNTGLGELNNKLTTIAETKEKIEVLQGDMVDFKNLFNKFWSRDLSLSIINEMLFL